MSDFISAIKRFVENWERNHPPTVAHYESVEDVVDHQADEHVELTQFREPEVPIEIQSAKEHLGQPPYGEGEGPGRWVLGLGNWQWLPDKPTKPPKGEAFTTGKWAWNDASDNWSWISIHPKTQPYKSDEQVLERAKQLIKEVEQLMKELE